MHCIYRSSLPDSVSVVTISRLVHIDITVTAYVVVYITVLVYHVLVHFSLAVHRCSVRLVSIGSTGI